MTNTLGFAYSAGPALPVVEGQADQHLAGQSLHFYHYQRKNGLKRVAFGFLHQQN